MRGNSREVGVGKVVCMKIPKTESKTTEFKSTEDISLVLHKIEVAEGVRTASLGTLNGTLNTSDRRVLEYVEANPGCRASAIMEGVSIPRDTLNKVIARLAKADKVERRGSKKTGGYYAKR